MALKIKVEQEAGKESIGLVDRLIGNDLGCELDFFPWSDSVTVPARLLVWTSALLKSARHPLFAAPRFYHIPHSRYALYQLVQPCMEPEMALSVFDGLIGLLNRIESGDAVNPDLRRYIENLKLTLNRRGLGGANPFRLLVAANELAIPWTLLPDKSLQVGVGAESHWLDSSITESTPSLAVKLSKNKVYTADLLRTAGVPVPKQKLVASGEQAEKAAELLGYPVVIKPADKDGGRAVYSALQSPGDLRSAFYKVEQASNRILVEKHIPGRDYRLTVIGGRVIKVVERSPGGVTGNGTDDVRTLVEHRNEIVARGLEGDRITHALVLDEEVDSLLASQALSLDSVPPAGTFVRLRGIANLARGGERRELPLSRVHRDNMDLALRAVRILRLDVAGVDLLMPDISESHHSVGGAICEVNAQPVFVWPTHKEFLLSLVGDRGGRIPVVISIASKAETSPIAGKLHSHLLARGVRSGFVNNTSVRLADQVIEEECRDSFSGARMLYHDPGVEIIILHTTDESIIKTGWPVDYCDVLIINDKSMDSESGAGFVAKWLNISRMLHPKYLLLSTGHESFKELASGLIPDDCVELVGKNADIDRIVKETARRLLTWHDFLPG